MFTFEWLAFTYDDLKYIADPMFVYRPTGWYYGREYEAIGKPVWDHEDRIMWRHVTFNPNFALTHLLPGQA